MEKVERILRLTASELPLHRRLGRTVEGRDDLFGMTEPRALFLEGLREQRSEHIDLRGREVRGPLLR